MCRFAPHYHAGSWQAPLLELTTATLTLLKKQITRSEPGDLIRFAKWF